MEYKPVQILHFVLATGTDTRNRIRIRICRNAVSGLHTRTSLPPQVERVRMLPESSFIVSETCSLHMYILSPAKCRAAGSRASGPADIIRERAAIHKPSWPPTAIPASSRGAGPPLRPPLPAPSPPPPPFLLPSPPAGFYGDGADCEECALCAPDASTAAPCAAGSAADTVTCACNAGFFGNGQVASPLPASRIRHVPYPARRASARPGPARRGRSPEGGAVQLYSSAGFSVKNRNLCA